ncbi:MAG: DUF177 domain-containing protein [Caldilineaceae bacterium]|nr:DUF177 domain-containing protein [Caldilineaceae bacterium]
MQYNVAQLLKEPTGGVRRYALAEDITQIDPDLSVLGPLVGNVQLMRTNSGILVTGELSTAVRSTCNRCTEPVAVALRFTLSEHFRPLTEVETGRYLRPDEFEGEADDLEDAALLISDHHILDLTEIVRQNLWLTLPMYPGCNWQGPGECPNLVKMLAELSDVRLLRDDSSSRDEEESVDPRWSALLALRDKTQGER